ncbi:amidase [Microvirga lotononidis]|uniref:Amidase, Asp-tRNAAsn/Glu-tRNAGln amidotransferase A subunit n=1 Tax=Microvirga lotononidis TaxID=864069 RepID=I4YT09_9HYPH|nr:amidase [Microvirga lotononidis]EIM27101.1 amidase, Asp-tRNAAsn/Glu-tRNAGln amidotransferase A subunit [Microvirga lotononidis]WQO28710.1 amidase [Microvirga lotononidis]
MLLDRDPAHAFMPYPAVPVPHAPSGPLSGLTFAAKDLFDVAGYPTSAGSPHMLAMSGIKSRTAPTVQKLLDAGARLVGKTITDELAFSMSGKNAHFGTPVNGGAPDRIPGGSSSGSAAAVSNGSCDFALGTDTGGSVRAPASHCGLFGIRPTHGRVSLEGCHDLAPSFDTCGYFTRDGATFVRVGEVLLGPDSAPLPQSPRVLLAQDAFGLLKREVRDALAPALRRAEAALGQPVPADVAPEGFTALYWAMRYIQSREAWNVDGPMIERYHPPLGPGVADRFEFSKAVTDAQVAEAQVIRAAFRKRFSALLADGAVLILPSMPDIAPLLAESDASLNDYRNNALNLLCLSVLSGLPQVSIPLASRSGAPLGLSIMGPAGSDLSLVALADRIAGSASA